MHPRPDAEAARPDARRDPLHGPLAVTEHCFIGDQIRLPAACCDIVGCGAEFADLAALGEADNRARALAAGWRVDAFSRLVCPACQQHHSVPGPRAPGAGPDTGGGPVPAAVQPGPGDGGSSSAPSGPGDGGGPSIRARIAGWQSAVRTGHHRMTRWPQVLTALVTGTNGWNAPQPVTGTAELGGPGATAGPGTLHTGG